MSKKVELQITAAAIIVNHGKALIIQRNKDEEIYPALWELPSGKKENFETIEKALAREVKEETGLKTKVGDIVSTFSYLVKKKDKIKDCVQINFKCQLIGERKCVTLSTEHQAYAWISRKNISKFHISNKTKKVLLATLKTQN